MLNRVLYHGLQDEVWYLRGQGSWFDFEVYLQSIAKPDLFYLQIAAQKFGFFLKCHQLFIRMIER